jgi:hypothetical protein
VRSRSAGGLRRGHARKLSSEAARSTRPWSCCNASPHPPDRSRVSQCAAQRSAQWYIAIGRGRTGVEGAGRAVLRDRDQILASRHKLIGEPRTLRAEYQAGPLRQVIGLQRDCALEIVDADDGRSDWP